MSFNTIAGGFNGASDGMVHFLQIEKILTIYQKLSCGFNVACVAIVCTSAIDRKVVIQVESSHSSRDRLTRVLTLFLPLLPVRSASRMDRQARRPTRGRRSRHHHPVRCVGHPQAHVHMAEQQRHADHRIPRKVRADGRR